MFSRRLGTMVGAALTAALLLARGVEAAEPITIIVAGMEKQIYLPAKLTERLGYFDEVGLNVRLVNAETGVEAQNELLSGAAQAAVGFYDHTITLQAKGFYVTSLVQFAQSPGEVEIVSERHAKKVDTPAKLSGHRLGVAGLGSSTDFLTRYIAYLNGLKFGSYTLVPIEAGNTFIQAMRRGDIDAGMTTEPTAGRLLRSEGAKILVDLRTPESTLAAFGRCYPGASLYVKTDWLSNHRDDAARMVTAFVKTMHYISTHSAAEIAAHLPADYFGGDKAFYIERLAEEKSMFTADGRMPPDCPEDVLKILSTSSRPLQDKQIDLASTYTNALVDAAIQSPHTPEDHATQQEVPPL